MKFRLDAFYPTAGHPRDLPLPAATRQIPIDEETYALLADLVTKLAAVARTDDAATGAADWEGHRPARRRPLTVARFLYLLARGRLQCYVGPTGRQLISDLNNVGANGHPDERTPATPPG